MHALTVSMSVFLALATIALPFMFFAPANVLGWYSAFMVLSVGLLVSILKAMANPSLWGWDISTAIFAIALASSMGWLLSRLRNPKQKAKSRGNDTGREKEGSEAS